ncbi:dynein regulatory complex protein 11 [Trichosurus vulpecula]|uniref:dynein regulatory complex protein 11 n=1 Tax=Trichosurus vulpecula TaxID=9337 RepID=UPI00186B05F4|nr:dynein regulatory complex protein 11 [Trichosurus vulpecula]
MALLRWIIKILLEYFLSEPSKNVCIWGLCLETPGQDALLQADENKAYTINQNGFLPSSSIPAQPSMEEGSLFPSTQRDRTGYCHVLWAMRTAAVGSYVPKSTSIVTGRLNREQRQHIVGYEQRMHFPEFLGWGLQGAPGPPAVQPRLTFFEAPCSSGAEPRPHHVQRVSIGAGEGGSAHEDEPGLLVHHNLHGRQTYNKMWGDAQEALNCLLEGESEKALEPPQDQVVIFQMLATFYVKYVQIFRNLENAYDQMVHPQKRILIRQVLDAVMGRILELKNEMVELELSEFHYFDDILQDLKLSPEQLDIPIPKYFLKEKMEVLREREKVLAQILANAGLEGLHLKLPLKIMPLEEAVKLIQISERARQGRLRAIFMRQIYHQDMREKQARLHGEKVPDPGSAAIRIQKFWRSFYQCKKTAKEKEEEMIFLGMNPSPHIQSFNNTLLNAQKVNFLRYEIQDKHEEEYKEALVTIKTNLKTLEGPDIRESLQDQIRHWFIECRNMTGTFPDYPKEEEGGSAIIFSERTPQQVVQDIIASEEEEGMKKAKKKEAKEDKEKKEKKKNKEKAEKKESKKNEEEEGWKMAPSLFIPAIEDGNNKYKGVWRDIDESWNFPQDYDPEMIKEEKRKELESEIRVQVDELMRQELKNLKLAVDREKEVPRKAKKKKEKKRGRKGKKGKKEKDLTPDRTLDSLYKELVEEELLIRPLKVQLSEYIGEFCYLGTTLRHVAIEPMPSLSDVRQLVTLYGILPLGNKERKLTCRPSPMEPRRLKKQLPKIIKLMKPEDRILIVGTTKCPFEADIKPLCKVYQKIIMIPRPDYASRFVLWKQVIQQAGGKITNSLNISCLSKVTDGFTQGQIVQVIKNILTDRRVRQQKQKALTAVEFITSLARMDPVYKEEEESFKTWYSKTPLGKKREIALSGADAKDKGKGKGKGKGKEKEKKGKNKGKEKK